ncbi:MBL fold metallo-hydrolase [Candidatus Villigracilis affinis]|uniref:MBL fold metallo-hydrolase n=1 Tax=Candidatus Villigracilis affinis TaxID=3140682 RepID=UPI001DB40613|nr:MBL fold metallo-hydrolase [Anaerolineales bacterium]
MNDKLRIKFWGVRGSYPAPGAGTIRYGGNTSCVEISAGGRTIILDAGTGIIPLGRELMQRKRPLELMLLFSHLHHDHTQGFPFFIPAYVPNTDLHIFGPGGTPETVKHVLEHNQSAETFPLSLRDMASTKQIESVRESQVIVWDEENVRVVGSDSGLSSEAVVIRIHKSYAHPGGVYVYRISWRGKSVVYATDTEGYVGMDRKLVAFARDADVLIHDAQYSEEHYRGMLAGFPSTQGYGHSTAMMAAEVAASAETGELVLFHHDPAYPDDWVAAQEAAAKNLFPDSCAAFEGMEIALSQRELDRMDVKYVKND